MGLKGSRIGLKFLLECSLLIVMSAACGLILVEPHLSATVLIGFVTIILLFAADKITLLLPGFVGLRVGIYTYFEGYRLKDTLSSKPLG